MGIREISKYFDRAINALKSFVDLIVSELEFCWTKATLHEFELTSSESAKC